jgi:hypothetical protein
MNKFLGSPVWQLYSIYAIGQCCAFIVSILVFVYLILWGTTNQYANELAGQEISTISGLIRASPQVSFKASLIVASAYYLWIVWQTYKPEYALRLRGHPKLAVLFVIFLAIVAGTMWALRLMEDHFSAGPELIMKKNSNNAGFFLLELLDDEREKAVIKQYDSDKMAKLPQIDYEGSKVPVSIEMMRSFNNSSMFFIYGLCSKWLIH